MLFSNLYAKMEEDKKKANPIDGRRFNVRSRSRMDREALVIKRSIAKDRRKKNSRKKSHQGAFSAEEIKEYAEENRQFREDMTRKREIKALKELESRKEPVVPEEPVGPVEPQALEEYEAPKETSDL